MRAGLQTQTQWVKGLPEVELNCTIYFVCFTKSQLSTDYGHPVRKWHHGKSTPTPKLLGM